VDALRIVHTCPRLQAVSGPSGSSQSSNARAPSLSSRARRSNLHFKNASKESLQSSVGQNCVENCFVNFWEAEVDNAWRRQDIEDLAWALQLAGEAGVMADKLIGPRFALKDLAKRKLTDALEQGDYASCSHALRICEMLGMDEVFLAEARLVMAEWTGDSFLIFQ